MLLDIVKNQIGKVLKENKEIFSGFENENNFKSFSFNVSYIEEEKFGHVSSNVAMVLAKDLKQNSKDVAQNIVEGINKSIQTFTSNTENITNKNTDRKSTRLNSSHALTSRMPSSA